MKRCALNVSLLKALPRKNLPTMGTGRSRIYLSLSRQANRRNIHAYTFLGLVHCFQDFFAGSHSFLQAFFVRAA